ncbi:hypothetical protein AB46_2389 [Escherichia coli 3-267-03_S1_C2]|nr:hypothetical protein AB46_2389 [Escherichia coli 3-267-03_S1_C2]
MPRYKFFLLFLSFISLPAQKMEKKTKNQGKSPISEHKK